MTKDKINKKLYDLDFIQRCPISGEIELVDVDKLVVFIQSELSRQLEEIEEELKSLNPVGFNSREHTEGFFEAVRLAVKILFEHKFNSLAQKHMTKNKDVLDKLK